MRRFSTTPSNIYTKSPSTTPSSSAGPSGGSTNWKKGKVDWTGHALREELPRTDWKLEAAKELEREAFEWDRRTLRAATRRMDFFAWLESQPTMRSYMKENFSGGQTWAPSSWRG